MGNDGKVGGIGVDHLAMLLAVGDGEACRKLIQPIMYHS